MALTPEAEAVRAKARLAVNTAVRNGVLRPIASLRCAACGAPANSYHHHKGYAPEHRLDVEPLCWHCHKRHHPAAPRLRHRSPPVASVPLPRLPTLAPAPLPHRRSLRQLRRYAGLSQRALADRAGVHWETIQAIETGKRARPHPATMAKIAAALGRRIEDITEFVNGDSPPSTV